MYTSLMVSFTIFCCWCCCCNLLLFPISQFLLFLQSTAVLLPPSATDTIVDIAVATPEVFSTLVSLVTEAGLVEALSGEGPFTVFAPTDEAFAAVPQETLDALLADTDLLTSVLLYHVVPGNVLSTDLSDGATAATLEGSEVAVTIDGDGVFINDALVANADILASNGVIHIIDKVLIPSAEAAAPEEEATEAPAAPTEEEEPAVEPGTIVDIASGIDDFSTLVAAVRYATLHQ